MISRISIDRFASPASITGVVHKVQGYGVAMVFNLLGERIGKARKHSHRQVLTLNIRGRYVVDQT